jgi:hypothetical protein
MLAIPLCILVAKPFAPIGICDDWSYIWTARVLAETGHLTYNGWGAMPLGWFAYVGALFIKLFGFSFNIVRSSDMVVSMLCAALMQRVFVRTGTTESTAAIATLSLVLSPLFFPLAFSFMSDIPALFVLVLCLYCCMRVFQAHSDNSALGWLIFAAFSNLVGGTVRQTAWLGVLLLMPATAWCCRRRRSVLPLGIVLWFTGALGIALYMRWFRAQPYAVIDKVFYKYHINSVFNASNTAITSLLCLVPILCAFIARHAPGKRLVRNVAAVTGAVLGSLLFYWAMKSPHDYFRTVPFSIHGNFVTEQGIFFHPILGEPELVVPVAVRFFLAVVIVSTISCFIGCVITARRTLFADFHRTIPIGRSYAYISNGQFLILFSPFVVAYLFLILTRSPVYDRYFLPLQFVFTIVLIRIYRQTTSERLPRLCLLVGLLVAIYAVVSTHDLFAFYRARAAAADEIISTGLPRTELEGGFEYDGWTQLEQTGYVNESRIVIPQNTYVKWISPDVPNPTICIGWFRKYSPSVHPHLHLSQSPGICYLPSQFAPVVYKTWLPVKQQAIYILRSY